MFMFGMDPLYLLVAGAAMLLALGSQALVKSAFGRYGKVRNSRGMTGAEAAKLMLDAEGVTDVAIRRHAGVFLSDHYNPADKTINLSPDIYDGTSVAAVGVACHEAGHALQHARRYAPLALRSFLVPTAGFGDKLGLPLIFIGLMMGAGGLWLVKLGLVLFSLVFLFQLVTLPVELNASARSREALVRHGIVRFGEETEGVSSVLNAAALTYVAAAAGTLLWILYYAYRAGLIGGRSRD